MSLFKPDLDAPYGYVHQTVQRDVDLEGFSRSSREKPVNTVEERASSNIRAVYSPALLNTTKRKTEV
jgi:hypothetical protein